jgi:hypothetical protein
MAREEPRPRHVVGSESSRLELRVFVAKPAGQIASRELEVQRITGALRRADELTDDVAAVLEPVASRRHRHRHRHRQALTLVEEWALADDGFHTRNLG